MIETKQIEDRIKGLTSELRALESSHDKLVRDFQTQVAKNQTRHAQLQGAIAELEQLKQPRQGGGNSEPARVRRDRVTAVRAP